MACVHHSDNLTTSGTDELLASEKFNYVHQAYRMEVLLENNRFETRHPLAKGHKVLKEFIVGNGSMNDALNSVSFMCRDFFFFISENNYSNSKYAKMGGASLCKYKIFSI